MQNKTKDRVRERHHINALWSFTGGSEFLLEPSTPPDNSRPSSRRKNGEDPESPSGFSPGLLDLQSFNTELLSEVGLLPLEVELHRNVEFCKIALQCWHCGILFDHLLALNFAIHVSPFTFAGL